MASGPVSVKVALLLRADGPAEAKSTVKDIPSSLRAFLLSKVYRKDIFEILFP
jgi:hypothetical protein